MKLSELSPDAQRRAYEKWRDHNLTYDWWEFVYEMAKEGGKERGFEIEEIYFSGFSSQGDGACWTGIINLAVFFNYFREREDSPMSPQQALLLSSAIPVLYDDRPAIISTGRYSHSGTMSIEFASSCAYTTAYDEIKEGAYTGMDESGFDALWDQHMESIENMLLKSAQDFADEIYKNLEDEQDYLNSEECFEKACESNDYEFDEEGEMK